MPRTTALLQKRDVRHTLRVKDLAATRARLARLDAEIDALVQRHAKMAERRTELDGDIRRLQRLVNRYEAVRPAGEKRALMAEGAPSGPDVQPWRKLHARTRSLV